MFKKRIPCLLMVVVLAGCASGYRPMIARHPSYVLSSENKGLILEYRYDELKNAGNKKYDRKAKDKGIQFVSVAFTNETDRTIHFGEDLAIYSGDRLIAPLQPEEVKREVRQVAGLYMIWSIFWVFITKCDDPNRNCSIIPLPVGLLIGIGNMSAANRANANFVDDMTHHSLMNKTIEPGETVYGILPIRAAGGEDLEVRWK